MRCPSCAARPAKRACPALGHDICPVCCGTKRQVDIRCPESCAYLASARSHPPAQVKRQYEQDMMIVYPAMMGLSEAQQRLFLLTVSMVPKLRGTGLDAARDVDLAEAAASLAASYETEAKGVIYEQRASTAPAQRMAAELRQVFEQLGRERPAAFTRDAAAVLRRIEQMARSTGPAGDRSVGLLELLGRIAARIGAGGPAEWGDPPAGSADDAPPPSSIIVP